MTADGKEQRDSDDRKLTRYCRIELAELKAAIAAQDDHNRIGPAIKAICKILPASSGVAQIIDHSDQRGGAPIEAVLAFAQARQVERTELQQQQQQQKSLKYDPPPPLPTDPPPDEYQPAPEGQPLDTSTESSQFSDSDVDGNDQIDDLKQAVESLQKAKLQAAERAGEAIGELRAELTCEQQKVEILHQQLDAEKTAVVQLLRTQEELTKENDRLLTEIAAVQTGTLQVAQRSVQNFQAVVTKNISPKTSEAIAAKKRKFAATPIKLKLEQQRK